MTFSFHHLVRLTTIIWLVAIASLLTSSQLGSKNISLDILLSILICLIILCTVWVDSSNSAIIWAIVLTFSYLLEAVLGGLSGTQESNGLSPFLVMASSFGWLLSTLIVSSRKKSPASQYVNELGIGSYYPVFVFAAFLSLLITIIKMYLFIQGEYRIGFFKSEFYDIVNRFSFLQNLGLAAIVFLLTDSNPKNSLKIFSGVALLFTIGFSLFSGNKSALIYVIFLYFMCMLYDDRRISLKWLVLLGSAVLISVVLFGYVGAWRNYLVSSDFSVVSLSDSLTALLSRVGFYSLYFELESFVHGTSICRAGFLNETTDFVNSLWPGEIFGYRSIQTCEDLLVNQFFKYNATILSGVNPHGLNIPGLYNLYLNYGLSGCFCMIFAFRLLVSRVETFTPPWVQIYFLFWFVSFWIGGGRVIGDDFLYVAMLIFFLIKRLENVRNH